MRFILEIMKRLRYWHREDRISPENPLTHWRLYFRSSMARLCRQKFKHFGAHAELRPFVFAGGCSNISIGNNVVVRPNSILFASPASEWEGKGAITIEDDVLLGPTVQLFTRKHRFGDVAQSIREQGVEEPKDIRIKEGAWIGAGVIIVGGVTIGRNAVIGAGSVVTRDIPDYALAVGAPAKVVRHYSETQI